MGFEAVLAGQKPKVFGQPFYAGWGPTVDDRPPDRRGRPLTVAQLFAGACLMYPTWYSADARKRVPFERAARNLQARAKAYWRGQNGADCHGFRLWKHGWARRALAPKPALGKVRFEPAVADPKAQKYVWGTSPAPDSARSVIRVEDGFIRSRGLGARLHAPMSLVLDDLGIYYDPRHPSRLEALIAESSALPDSCLRRAADLRAQLVARRVSKYNLGAGKAFQRVPSRPHLLVVGQVGDDASILCGAGEINDDRTLIRAAREHHSDAVLVYKPHPDVLAGLRSSAAAEASELADIVLGAGDITDAIDACDAVWTMTSLAGFEALLRGKPVTCTGMPFYAGWGLTTDLTPPPTRRGEPVSLDALVHAALIDYPIYFHPVSGQPVCVEEALDLLDGPFPRRSALQWFMNLVQQRMLPRSMAPR